MTLKAKNIVENRFWILENERGERIGNIAQTSNGVRCTVSDTVEMFPSMEEMIEKKGIAFARKTREPKFTTPKSNDVHGFPTDHTPHNVMWNVKNGLPIYTKNEKSSSYYCAGYYIVKYDKTWAPAYAPKLITLQRYPYQGPFKTKIEQTEKLRKLANETSEHTSHS